MKSFGLIIVIAIIMYGFSILYEDLKHLPEVNKENQAQQESVENSSASENLDLPEGGINHYFSMNQEELIAELGEPDRIDSSSYGYQWWIYEQNPDQYIQFGVEKGKIVTVFVLGKNIDISPLKIGEKTSEVQSKVNIEGEVPLNVDGNRYRFELTQEELNTRPLVKINGIWAQLYLDQFDGTLVGARYLDPKVLVMQRPYSLEYRGELIEQPKISSDERKQIRDGEEEQIFTITNVIRQQYGQAPLQWHENTAQVAYGHSKEMSEENYFAHESPISGSLSDRLENGDIRYLQAGENIAANYIDGIEAVIGWLNSEGHRKALLNKDFTHLGVGVYEKYYTQNFIVPFE
ncbi:CAP domain-containing protein [Pseudalkalibacillus sp. Hm43]|uniref:CAP domain-containing protein n=1 Tax=Pseudalkalibacillus sp. Hm43 TaxID=3450742 RepID=UPI003F429158